MSPAARPPIDAASGEVAPELLTALWRAFYEAGSPLGRPKRLGALLVAREDPRLVVCDPHLIAGARPLERAVRGDSCWTVSILRRGARVAAALASRGRDWHHAGVLLEPGRVWRFERDGGDVWEVWHDGALVTESAVKAGRASPVKTKEHGDAAGAAKTLHARIGAKLRVGFRAVPAAPELPLRWERAVFEGGADRFPVDYAVAAITDARSAESIRQHESLRTPILRAVGGPPGCELFDDGTYACDLAWFGSGEGDGRYACAWGMDAHDELSVLLIPFLT